MNGHAGQTPMTTFTEPGIAISARGLGKEYRSRFRGGSSWALRDCTFELPTGRVAALVGLNGAGKTTLMSMIASLLVPSEGQVEIGEHGAAAADRVAFVAQDKPFYRSFSVADMLRVGRRLNRVWDQDRAERWLSRFEVPLHQPCGKLSGGQQAQVSLAIALGSCPTVLLLDEPLANLDPLARRHVTMELLSEVADTRVSVLMSTHVVAELDGVADYLLLLAKGRLVLEGDVDDLVAEHIYYVGPESDSLPDPWPVIQESHLRTQSSFLVRLPKGEIAAPPAPPWTTRPASFEDIIMAYLAKHNGARL
ncbi:ABC transporter ATP-binding protein [Amycolatopsis sp. NPDC054798]